MPSADQDGSGSAASEQKSRGTCAAHRASRTASEIKTLSEEVSPRGSVHARVTHKGEVMFVQGKRFAVFSLLDRPDKKHEGKETPKGEKGTIWTRAGSAWLNRDGSMNLFLDVLPLQGRLHVREV